MEKHRPKLPASPVVIVRKRTARVPRPAAPPAAVSSATAEPALAMAAPSAPPPGTDPVAPAAPASSVAATPAGPLTPAVPDAAAVAAASQQRQEKVRAVLAMVMARWPQVFPADPRAIRPLALGINQQVVVQLPGVSRWEVSRAIGRWRGARLVGYLQAMIRGGPRYGLEGQPQGSVSEAERQQARAELAAWYARRAARRPAPVPPAYSEA